MARPAPDPEKRAIEIVDAATRVFAEKGYRRAQMTDIAKEMGASPGTLYNAVTSKEALFRATLLYNFGLLTNLTDALWSETVDVMETINDLSERVELFQVMASALTRPIPDEAATFEAELREIVSEHFDFMARNGDGVRILEKSTIDFPELSKAYFGILRGVILDRWETYLARAKAAGYLGAVEDTSIAARSAIEVISWWTIRMPNDPGTEHYNETNIRSEVIAFALRGIMKG